MRYSEDLQAYFFSIPPLGPSIWRGSWLKRDAAMFRGDVIIAMCIQMYRKCKEIVNRPHGRRASPHAPLPFQRGDEVFFRKCILFRWLELITSFSTQILHRPCHEMIGSAFSIS